MGRWFHTPLFWETLTEKEFVLYFQGWPKLLWFVTESKHLSKPPRDWFPHIKDANNDTAYIEVSPRVWGFGTESPRFP